MHDQVIIGMDPHKASNTIAVLTKGEELFSRRRFENSDDGFIEMLAAVDENHRDFGRSRERTGSAGRSLNDSSHSARPWSMSQRSSQHA